MGRSQKYYKPEEVKKPKRYTKMVSFARWALDQIPKNSELYKKLEPVLRESGQLEVKQKKH